MLSIKAYRTKRLFVSFPFLSSTGLECLNDEQKYEKLATESNNNTKISLCLNQQMLIAGLNWSNTWSRVWDVTITYLLKLVSTRSITLTIFIRSIFFVVSTAIISPCFYYSCGLQTYLSRKVLNNNKYYSKGSN